MLDIHHAPTVLLYSSGQLVDEFTCAGDSGPRVRTSQMADGREEVNASATSYSTCLEVAPAERGVSRLDNLTSLRMPYGRLALVPKSRFSLY